MPVTPGRFKRQVLSRFRWVIHPVSVFIIIQVLWAAILTLWVVWFVGRQREIERLALQLSPSLMPKDDASVVWLVVTGVIMLSMLGAGTILLFTWGQRQSSLILQQRDFVSSVTHELRTPLSSIHLAYETMAERALSEETRKKLLSMTLVDIERLIRLVNQILISSRLDRGLSMFKDDVQDLNIRKALHEILGTLIHLDRNIFTRVKLSIIDSINWRGSYNAFTMVLGNLLENAIKYSPAHSDILVNVRECREGIEISVQDFGMGLNSRDKKKIFKMFYRSVGATSQAIPGTGLGLFIVKTTMEQLGGTIKVSSLGVGEGSKFTAVFPV